MEISKRDYFAAQALTGLLARPSGPSQSMNVHSNVAAEAFLYADEMLKLSRTLLDPVEIDPDNFPAGETQQPQLRDKKASQ
jgi:hypothetical protein